ncbi:DUF3025 domain-containing protein [uncultured Ramlibacter sp.]|uniref:DUF3025 domain-containing protein n=1 Tax=uncultured Ramlibacter sp. TaxID=260755 RepID=UPI00260649B4|nr:DUF3025 domain-containing protein [uncultured Ramlibacter sp.]
MDGPPDVLSRGGVDWSRPWFAPWQGPGGPVLERVAAGQGLHDALNAADGAPLRFVPQAALPAATPYERYIFESNSCPVRGGWHDFFNGICWLGLPQAKLQMNRLQAAQIAVAGEGAPRGPVRDAITVFDENGALLDAPPPLWEALRARDWRRLFVTLRPLWHEARLLVTGHALLEKLLAPRKALTAHVWNAQCPLDRMEIADAWLAGELTPQALAAKPFMPLPVLGLPRWWPQNQNFSFYDDSLVFRSRRPPK